MEATKNGCADLGGQSRGQFARSWAWPGEQIVARDGESELEAEDNAESFDLAALERWIGGEQCAPVDRVAAALVAAAEIKVNRSPAEIGLIIIGAADWRCSATIFGPFVRRANLLTVGRAARDRWPTVA